MGGENYKIHYAVARNCAMKSPKWCLAHSNTVAVLARSHTNCQLEPRLNNHY